MPLRRTEAGQDFQLGEKLYNEGLGAEGLRMISACSVLICFGDVTIMHILDHNALNCI